MAELRKRSEGATVRKVLEGARKSEIKERKDREKELQLQGDLHVSEWDCHGVSAWLRSVGLGEYEERFRQQKIDGEVLLALNESDLRDPLLGLKAIGDIKRLWFHLRQLQDTLQVEDGYVGRLVKDQHWKQDAFPKFLASFAYMTVVSFLTAVTMTIVHDRVPDTATYPPLPDIMLDNIPLIHFAFELAEIIILSLGLIFLILLCFHRHRIILLRRFFAITATVFLLRCVTMFVTSLSVPGVHLKCDARVGSSMEEKLAEAWRIMSGLALSINGLRTCGDYMFSGHTIVMTLLNYFINEYSPSNYEGLRIVTWVLNFFGMFFVLAAHEHYTIDVVVAFYISSRLFTHYHDLASGVTLSNRRGLQRRSFLPMFHYFEEHSDGVVPNEFEWPWAFVSRFLSARRREKGRGIKSEK